MKTESKEFEIRDVATMIPVMGTKIMERSWLTSHAGWGEYIPVLLTKLHDGTSNFDAYEWGHSRSRTMLHAHLYINEHWSELKDGDVIDIEYILGETGVPKISERESYSQFYFNDALKDALENGE